MSTRSSIFWDFEAHIYDETSEPVITWGKHRGNNIYGIFNSSCIKEWKISKDHLHIVFKKDSNSAKALLPEMKISLYGMVEVGAEDDEFFFVLSGDSVYNGAMRNKKFHVFAPGYEVKMSDLS